MATHYSTEYGVSVNTPPKRVNSQDARGKVRCISGAFSKAAASVSNGDKVRFGRMPKGAKVVEAKLAFGALGTSASLKLGDAGDGVAAADDDRYIAATDASSAGVARLGNTAGAQFVTQGECEIEAVVANKGTADPVAFKAEVYFIED